MKIWSMDRENDVCYAVSYIREVCKIFENDNLPGGRFDIIFCNGDSWQISCGNIAFLKEKRNELLEAIESEHTDIESVHKHLDNMLDILRPTRKITICNTESGE